SLSRKVSGDLASTANLAEVVSGVPTSGLKQNTSAASGASGSAARGPSLCNSQVPRPTPPMKRRSTDSGSATQAAVPLETSIRRTRDVELLVRRADLGAARTALEAAGFVYHHLLDVDTFVDGPQGRPSGGIHILFAGEKVRPEYEHPSPDLDESERAAEFQV